MDLNYPIEVLTKRLSEIEAVTALAKKNSNFADLNELQLRSESTQYAIEALKSKKIILGVLENSNNA